MKEINVDFDGFICRIAPLPPNIASPLERFLALDIEDSIYNPMVKKTFIPLSTNSLSGNRQAVINLGGRLFFLTGLLPKVLKFLKSYQLKPVINSRVSLVEADNEELTNLLYPHQKRIIQAVLYHKRGILKAPTGSGKTVVIAELTRLFSSSKVFITVPTVALLYQMRNEIVKFYNLIEQDPPPIGLIGDGNYDFSQGLTVCIPDTAVNRIERRDKEFIKYLSTVNVLLSDEVHQCGNTSFGIVAGKLFNRRVSCGFSATPWVNTGANIIIEGFFGSKIAEINETEMIERGVIMKPIVKFYNAPAGQAPPELLARDYSHYVYDKLYNFLIVNNRRRNQLIVDLAYEFITKQEGPLIILVNKVGTVVNKQTGKPGISHSKLLQELLEVKGINLEVLHGGTHKKERESIFNKLRESSIPGIIAGPKIMSEGVDIPSISCVILAGAGKSDKDMLQRMGRALRLSEGKTRPLVIDMIDPTSYFLNQSYNRMDTVEAIYPGCIEII